MKAQAITKNRKHGRWNRDLRLEQYTKDLKICERDFKDCSDIINGLIRNCKSGKVVIKEVLGSKVITPALKLKPAKTLEELQQQLRDFRALFRICLKASEHQVADLWRYKNKLQLYVRYSKKYRKLDPVLGKQKLDFLFQRTAALKKFYTQQAKQSMSNTDLQGMIQDV